MLFNSIEFAVFLPIVFILYWFVFNKDIRLQNIFLIAASYVFYGWWDWKFLALIVFSSLVDFLIGKALWKQYSENKRKGLLLLSISVNIGLLLFFKYYNFFIDSFVEAYKFFGYSIEPSRLNIVLPVGISFYTFQTLSYTADIYRRKFSPTNDPISFFAFVSFFPQLVAGPIERASHLLPQFRVNRSFEHSKAVDGVRQVLWGLFKKIVIADNCAFFVNDIFSNYEQHTASTLAIGAILFAFQIYGDFSGYSDIAIGTSRLFGFDIMRNFAYPYFSRDIAEFWRRWHISLSTWFRDYLYIPLGGSRLGNNLKVRNTFIIFLVSGFWHGANWTFVAWGFIHACLFLPLILMGKNRVNTDIVAENKRFPSAREVVQMALTFILVVLAWVFFRSETIYDALKYIQGIFDRSLFIIPSIFSLKLLIVCFFVCFQVLIEWMGRLKKHPLENIGSSIGRIGRWSFYYLLIMLIIFFGGDQEEFIYFQF